MGNGSQEDTVAGWKYPRTNFRWCQIMTDLWLEQPRSQRTSVLALIIDVSIDFFSNLDMSEGVRVRPGAAKGCYVMTCMFSFVSTG